MTHLPNLFFFSSFFFFFFLLQGGGPNGWMSRVRPQSSSRKKKGSRCRAHGSFRKHVDPSEWRTVWEKAPDEFKIGIASMLPSELLQVTCPTKQK